MLGSFRRIVVITYHIVMMECASGTSKRLGADIGHLKASWDFLGDGESVDHIVMRNVSICIMVTDTYCVSRVPPQEVGTFGMLLFETSTGTRPERLLTSGASGV